MCHGGNPKASLTWGPDYIRTRIVPDNEKMQALAAIHSQTLQTNNTLKYYWEFYLHKNFKITSLIHFREYSLYVLNQVDKTSVRTSSGRQNYRRSNTIFQRSAFNTHLPSDFFVHRYFRYRVRRTPVHHNRVVTLRRVFRRVSVDRRGRVVSSY